MEFVDFSYCLNLIPVLGAMATAGWACAYFVGRHWPKIRRNAKVIIVAVTIWATIWGILWRAGMPFEDVWDVGVDLPPGFGLRKLAGRTLAKS